MPREPIVTMKSLAEELGISPSTVSRVLSESTNGPSRWASDRTRQRILDLAHEVGYSKNPHAYSLRTSQSRMIGVVVPRLQDFVLATIYEGADEAATEAGYFTVVVNSLDDPDAHTSKVQQLLDRRVDGFLLGDIMMRDQAVDQVKRAGVPYVLVNRRSPGSVSVTCNDYLGGRLAAQRFIETGRTTFGVLAGDPQASTAHDRVRGFRDAVREHGFRLDDRAIVPGGFDATAGHQAALRLLDHGTLPEAVFAVNDFSAIGARGALAGFGISVPDDVAMIGYNDTPLAPAVNLTTIHSPMHDMGAQGMRVLLTMLRGEAGECCQLEPSLVVRDTA
ncbi:substrate-binding domain-containing protein [Kocuria koreensis]|uniref:Substrate-binding domain-containing protein n=1 Tax=Rothia koreensis TaxID=592378 RepID=A0A7K1LH70_9MICC|nr:LacI family DNA-binding transcriptional regulator [Rothia koreensis]MUN54535.1 substrate-binding domain-containing protein [Rothia koreensis]